MQWKENLSDPIMELKWLNIHLLQSLLTLGGCYPDHDISLPKYKILLLCGTTQRFVMQCHSSSFFAMIILAAVSRMCYQFFMHSGDRKILPLI